MASLSTDKNGKRRILFVHPKTGKRKAIHLGKIPKKPAETIHTRVEYIINARKLGTPIDTDTATWLGGLESHLYDKLVAVDLVPSRQAKDTAKLAGFLTEYMESRIDVKPATKVIWGHTKRNLIKHFGADRDLTDVNEGDAEDFKLYLVGEKLSPTTIHKRLQVARMFFRAARKRKIISANPFADVSAKAVIRADRQRFITREETEQLLAVCNPTWRMIVALCRYGGMRCPSEVLTLRWENVLWDKDRIIVQSPKTEHHPGKDYRIIPMFPELKPFFDEAWELAGNDAEYVVGGGYREAAQSPQGWRNCNLRTQFERLIKRAGLKPWPRLFHAMRASRETELAKSFPIHVVTAWIGNTPKIAMKHYLQVTDADFEEAIGKERDAENDAHVAQITTQHTPAPVRPDSQPMKKALGNQGLMQSCASSDEIERTQKVAGAGFEPATSRL